MDKRPLRVGLVFLSAALALAAMLLTGCGGGGADEGAKVEASLQDYLRTPYPQQSLGDMSPVVGVFIVGVFPIGAGPPQVRENSCKKIHTGKVRPARLQGLSGWSCVITFSPGKTALPVAVAVKGSGEVYWAAAVSQQGLTPTTATVNPAPATVYEGGP